MSTDSGKVVLHTPNCEITVATTEEEGVKIYLQQGGHIVLLSVPEWNDVRRATERAISFIQAGNT